MCLICHTFCAREISELRQFRINPWIPGVKNYKLYVKFSWISDLWSLRWSKPTTSDFDPTNSSNFCHAFCAREISELRQFEVNPRKSGVKIYIFHAKFYSFLNLMSLSWSNPARGNCKSKMFGKFCYGICAREISELSQFEINPRKSGVKKYIFHAKFWWNLESMNSVRFRDNLVSHKSWSDGIRTLSDPLWPVSAFRCIWTRYG